jgi:sulfur carrier protein
VIVRVNGREHTVDAGITIAALLERLAVPADGVAVAVGHEVVPRTRHQDRRLEEGDEIEIVRAVGGG